MSVGKLIFTALSFLCFSWLPCTNGFMTFADSNHLRPTSSKIAPCKRAAQMSKPSVLKMKYRDLFDPTEYLANLPLGVARWKTPAQKYLLQERKWSYVEGSFCFTCISNIFAHNLSCSSFLEDQGSK